MQQSCSGIINKTQLLSEDRTCTLWLDAIELQERRRRMSAHSDDDSTPLAKPPRRPHVQSLDERDGAGVGQRARTAHLEYTHDSIPVEAPEDITDVHRLVSRVLDGESFTPSQIRLVESVIGVVSRHVDKAERRRMNGDLAVAAVNGDEQTGRRLTELETRSIVISGEDGTNGRLGTLRAEVKTLRSGLITIARAVLGGSVASAKAIYAAVESRGAERAEFAHMRETVDTLAERQDTIRMHLFGIRPAPAGTPGVTP